MVQKEKGSITNARKQKLVTAAWLPEGTPTAAILWHHGMGEYADRFDSVFPELVKAGIAVFSYDAHGHGDSEPTEEGKRGFFNCFQDLVDDATQYYDEIKARLDTMASPAPLLFIGGNSLGGLVASHLALARPAVVGLIMQSPAIDVEWNAVLKVQAFLGNGLSAMIPYAKVVPAVRPEDMSVDPERVKAFIDDKRMLKGNVRARSGNEILKGFRSLKSKRAGLTLPIYATHGTGDRCTSLPALREHLKQVGSKDVTLVEVPGAFHELLQGPEMPAVVEGINAWVLSHAAAKDVPALALA